jgi:hypothetical protein
MDWGNDRSAAIAELQSKVRASGSFVDRAIVREMKIASERFSETHSAWLEVIKVAAGWEDGTPDLQVLEALRRINRMATCWKDKPA